MKHLKKLFLVILNPSLAAAYAITGISGFFYVIVTLATISFVVILACLAIIVVAFATGHYTVEHAQQAMKEMPQKFYFAISMCSSIGTMVAMAFLGHPVIATMMAFSLLIALSIRYVIKSIVVTDEKFQAP